MRECVELREWSIEGGASDDARFRRHAAECPDCREQLETERELRDLFRGAARPAPSLHFDRVLRQRLRAERRRLNRRRWRLAVMQGYWAAASAACVLVMARIQWPSELPSMPVACLFGSVLGLALLAPLVLLRSLRIGPLDLIVKTMEAFRG